MAPDLDELAALLAGGADALRERVGYRAIVGPAAELAEPDDVPTVDELLENGAKAVRRLRDQGEDAELTDAEAVGLEAVISLALRPAIVLKNGTFPASVAHPWQQLETHRDGIQRTAERVGRIELHNDPEGRPFGGTGFLVGPGLVMTNAHVAKLFAAADGAGRWTFVQGRAGLDFRDSPDGQLARYEVTDVVGIHPAKDLALFHVQSTVDGRPLPSPLVLGSKPPENVPGQQVYTVGYPAWDPYADPHALRVVFGDIYNVKRLQPGAIMSFHEQRRVFRHDCSTLGGNSGSCVVDVGTNLVLGLHFGGLYLKYNEAVALWALKDDPLLQSAGVRFD